MSDVLECKNLIGGEWSAASDGATFETHNPARTEQVLARFPMATREDVRRAIDAARAALPGWARTPLPQRGAILDKAASLIEARANEMASTLTAEEGKTLAEAKGEVLRARDTLRYYAGEGWRAGGEVLPGEVPDHMIFTKREPVGVVSIITPWNFPIVIPAWKLGPALIYGNTVVFKPASYTPQIAMMLVQALVEAGLPTGVLNFITGSGKVAGEEMTTNPGVNAISFTGSYEVGSGINERAMKNMTRVQLEMGGKNPLIVLEDADVGKAVDIAAKSAFGLTGQACTAASRVIVVESLADPFAQALAQAADKLPVGNGMDKATRMGPAVSKDQLETDLSYIKIGQEEGAKLLAGGGTAHDGGYFVQPTVFDHVEPDMRIAQEEVFGPVLGIIRAKDLDDAVEKANGIGYGLSAGIVTNNLQKALAFADRIDAGVVKINEPTIQVALHAPFGGFKHSSANTFKEQGQAAIEFYTRTKTVYVRYK